MLFTTHLIKGQTKSLYNENDTLPSSEEGWIFSNKRQNFLIYIRYLFYMRKFIKKILKESDKDFKWVDEIEVDPQEAFLGYFNVNRDKHFKEPIEYWTKWVNNVELSLYSLHEDVEELYEFTEKLIGETTRSKEFKMYVGYVWDMVKRQPSLNNETFLSDNTKTILEAYKKLGPFMEMYGFSMIQVLGIFKNSLKKINKK